MMPATSAKAGQVLRRTEQAFGRWKAKSFRDLSEYMHGSQSVEEQVY